MGHWPDPAATSHFEAPLFENELQIEGLDRRPIRESVGLGWRPGLASGLAIFSVRPRGAAHDALRDPTRSTAPGPTNPAQSYLALRSSLRIASSASMTSSFDARLFENDSFRLKALVGGRYANT